MFKTLLLAFALLAGITGAAAQDFSVKEIPTLPQLPDMGLHSIYRDSEGYMWYATNNGLARDDGYSINIFRPDPDSFISHIAEDSKGRIWISTSKGAYFLDKADYILRPFDTERLHGSPVYNVYFTRDGNAWVNQRGFLHRYDAEGRWLRDYPLIDRRGSATTVSGFCQTRNGDILITTYSRGVYRYDPSSDSFRLYAPLSMNVSLGEIMQDVRRDYLWVSDHDGHLFRFDPTAANPDSIYILSPIVPPGRTVGEQIYNFTQDPVHGYLWAVSLRHLMAFEPQQDGSLKPLALPVCEHYSGAMFENIRCDSDRLWLSAFDRPSCAILLRNSNVEMHELPALLRRHPDSPGLMSVVTAVEPDDTHRLLWVVQRRDGLVLYDTESNRVTYHDDDIHMKPMRLHEAEDMTKAHSFDGVWLSQRRSITVHGVSHDGMRMLKTDSVKLDGIVSSGTRVTKILEDSSRHLWIGTTRGIYGYDIMRRTFDTRAPEAEYVVGIAEGSDGSIWCASKNKGIFRIPAAGMSADVYPPPFANGLSAIALAPNGRLWLGTDDGRLLSFDPHSHRYDDHSAVCDMGGISIKQISVDRFGHVWAVTDQRLIEYNPLNGSRRTYASGDDTGLGRFLTTNPAYDHRDRLMLGGVGGIAAFTPTNTLDRNECSKRTFITDITVGGSSLIFNDSTTRFNGREVRLSPDDRNIGFHFSTLDPDGVAKSLYAYRIRGIDPDWNYTLPGQNRAFYNSIPKGKFVLEVRVCDENNLWSSEITTLSIDRRPAFYETWWAYTLYILLGAALCAGLFILITRRAKRESEEMWADSSEMMKMRRYLESPVTLPEEEFKELDKAFLRKATKAVEANLAVADFNVDSLAREVNMSRSTLSRKLRAITGKRPLEFILSIKMRHACRLLENQNHSVGEVAEMVGYFDRRYFTASFKKAIGVLPSDYQKGARPEPPKG